MLNVMRKHFPIHGGMTPGFKSNLLPQLAGEAPGPLAARVMLGDILDGVRVDIFLVVTYVV